MSNRRVVMGTSADGNTVVLSDGPVEPVTATLLPGVEIYRCWELDKPSIPVAATEDGGRKSTFFPPPGGIRFGFLTIPPGIDYIPAPDADLNAAAAEMEEKLPGAAATFSTERPGEHTTQSVDYIIVLSGSAVMRAPGVEVRLNKGDCLIQNGTPHAWFNDGDEPLVLGYTLTGVEG
ncbi:cupin domain-containing protein [Nocardia donostiensis]|uniref:Cupin type-2 domain-containing protein n=1 Tax=Nocardia donostiensis TaxID=1538463 RepID=A0A1V2TLP4_9NOCA|nr:cupin domain-containing protein [Nocardia donostiensis]ONM50447.1 hypothetical protein B0T46_00525 [Nocardia donostiensis]OQS17317.1 hypothetical protein B0T36_01630 [Nocardia donostiensis]OQS18702.1 hypothetical protein B0T44_17870 [Nocardia donostiensis]